MIGKRYERLTVVIATMSGKYGRKFVCRCDCGVEVIATVAHLNAGRVRSCGCLKRDRSSEAHLTHGGTGTRTYNIWQNVRQRCENPRYPRYSDYGGRGIAVCDRWKRFENFLADMGEAPSDKSIDRWPDNNGNYEPDNCRWATRVEQANNKRNNRLITQDGVTKTLTQWLRDLGISKAGAQYRLRVHGTIFKARPKRRG